MLARDHLLDLGRHRQPDQARMAGASEEGGAGGTPRGGGEGEPLAPDLEPVRALIRGHRLET